MKNYEKLEIEIVLPGSECCDVITASNDNEVNIDDIFGTMGSANEDAYNVN